MVLVLMLCHSEVGQIYQELQYSKALHLPFRHHYHLFHFYRFHHHVILVVLRPPGSRICSVTQLNTNKTHFSFTLPVQHWSLGQYWSRGQYPPNLRILRVVTMDVTGYQENQNLLLDPLERQAHQVWIHLDLEKLDREMFLQGGH